MTSVRKKICNMVVGKWDLMIVSLCAVQVTQRTIVESRDVNTVYTDTAIMSIDDQLKTIGEEKHQKYFLNTGCKLPSLENAKSKENAKQFSEPQARKENIHETAETYKESNWPLGIFPIVGDSMVNGILKKKLQKHRNAKVLCFPGTRINAMNHHLMSIIAKQPDYLILHVGTNDSTTNTFRKVIDGLLMLKCLILKPLQN